MTAAGNAAVDLTVLVCTYNRVADLQEVLTSAIEQSGANTEFRHEILVVDNNSTDGTDELVARLRRDHAAGETIRYLRENRQGKVFALNTGIAAARGAIIAIVDDDQYVPTTYVRDVVRAFRERPGISFLGGKVLPLWESSPPTWLTDQMWGPLALCDYGSEEFEVPTDRDVCLLSCTFRTAALQSVGGMAARMFVSEDAEVQRRLAGAGYRGAYIPSLFIYHKAPNSRLNRRYYRYWHGRHGRSIAVLNQDHSRRAVPGYIVREAASSFARWTAAMLRRRPSEAFKHELALRFAAGFIAQRLGRNVMSDSGSAKRAVATAPVQH